MGLSKSAFSTNSFGKLVLRLYVFSLFSVVLFQCRCYKLHNICIIIVFIGATCSKIFFLTLLFVKICEKYASGEVLSFLKRFLFLKKIVEKLMNKKN